MAKKQAQKTTKKNLKKLALNPVILGVLIVALIAIATVIFFPKPEPKFGPKIDQNSSPTQF